MSRIRPLQPTFRDGLDWDDDPDQAHAVRDIAEGSCVVVGNFSIRKPDEEYMHFCKSYPKIPLKRYPSRDIVEYDQ